MTTGDAQQAKTWLITGVSSGFGRALALAALARRDQVIGTVRTETALQAFEALGRERARGKILDLTDGPGVHRLFQEIDAIDVLVCNAGYGLVAGVEEASLAEIRAQFEVNFFGTVALLQAALPMMRQRRQGRILVISSVSGVVGWPSLGVYSASKFALEGLCETLAQEVLPLGIRLTLVEPGGFRTDFATRSRRQSASVIEDYHATVGANRAILADHSGFEPGDPAKAAQALLTLVDHPNPPLRLLLGSDAIGYAETKLTRQLAQLEEWRVLSSGTDFDTA